MRFGFKKIKPHVWGLFIILAVSGCGQFKKTEPINIDCNEHVVVYDSFQILLATLDINQSNLVKHKIIKPTNDVVGQAIFNCKNGVLIYNSEEKMKTSVEGTLNLVFDNDVIKIKIENGINAIFPYGEDEILIRTQIVKKSSIDYDLGSADAFENSRMQSASAENDLTTDKQHVYTDDLIFNLKSKTIRKTVRGTFNPHYLHDGKFITYSSDKSVIEFFPENGNRAVLENYQEAFVNHKEKTITLPQHGGQYFYSNKSLFLINGETPSALLNKEESYLPKNILFEHIRKSGWKEVAKLRSRPIVAFLNNGKIISIGNSSVLEYDIATSDAVNYSIPINDVMWKSASIVQSKYILTGMKDMNARIFVFSDDFREILFDEKLTDFIRPNISTMNLPLPPRQVIE